MSDTGRLLSLYRAAQSGQISRRVFLERATQLGMAAPVLAFTLQHGFTTTAVAAQDATPAASPATAATATAPSVGTESQQRGAGGELKLLQWQAPTHMATHSALGGKDNEMATLVLEPLMHYSPEGLLIPNLVKEVPSQENRLLAADNTSVTYNLVEGVTWSDGEPFTANDVVFTWKWITDPANGATDTQLYEPIANAEALSDIQVKLTFKEAQPAWYLPFTGSWWGSIYPAHILDGKGADAYQAFMQKAIGTGPYVVESFTSNDSAVLVANDKYREANKPFFSKVSLKGGGDPASAARAVLETGDYHFAITLQLEPELLQQMQEAGNGKVLVNPGALLETIYLNFSDPNKEVDGERSSLKAPHPFLTDKAVRQAMNLAVNRDLIATRFYGPGQPATANVLVGLAAYESKNTSYEFNVDKANQMLDTAGWGKNGDVRKKDGVELSITYATTINQVRQKTQAVVKQGFEAIGFKVSLQQVDSGVYFDSAAGNDQSYTHFYTDLGMSAATIDTPFPLKYMSVWYAGPDNKNIAQKSNSWGGANRQRYVNPEYDALFEAVTNEIDPAKSAELFIQMNDLIVNDVAVIPLVQRSTPIAASNKLREENLIGGAFETSYWNIANWNTVDGGSIG